MGFASELADHRLHNRTGRTMIWELDEGADSADRSMPSCVSERPAAPNHDSTAHDLERVEQLLERCWREIDHTELGVKLSDLVRLLEFKGKLRPAADAERTFWSMIDQMRREELARFSDAGAEDRADDTLATDHETGAQADLE